MENLGHYAGLVKDETRGRLPTLAFYGYISDWDWAVECDHRAVSAALRLKSLDMLSAPHTYRRRGLGEDGQMRTFAASIARHGKFFISEGDDRTHLESLKAKPDGYGCAKTPADTRALLWREFGMAVTHGAGLWYMDIGKENFRDPGILSTVACVRKASEESLRHDRAHISDVAVVSNPESEFYLGYRRTEANNISYVGYVDQMAAFWKAGAPFDWYVADDLDAVAERNYKVVVFLDCQYLTSKQAAWVERLKFGGRTLVFIHATGYVSETGLSRERMERICGMKMKPGTVRGIVAETGVGAGLCAVGTQALTVTGNVFRRCGKDANRLAEGERSCQVRLEGCRGLAMTGNACRAGRDDGGKGLYTPQVGFIVKNLAHSVISGNALHQGYMEEKIVDLGGHGEEFILKDNVGCPMKD